VPVVLPLNLTVTENRRIYLRVMDFGWRNLETIGQLWVTDEAAEVVGVVERRLPMCYFPLKQ
jgi:hypothetical protein